MCAITRYTSSKVKYIMQPLLKRIVQPKAFISAKVT